MYSKIITSDTQCLDTKVQKGVIPQTDAYTSVSSPHPCDNRMCWVTRATYQKHTFREWFRCGNSFLKL